MKDIVVDLAERLELLHVRHGIVFRSLAPSGDVPQLAVGVTRGLYKQEPDAVQVCQALIDQGELERADFWGSPLGRRLFLAGGYRKEAVTQSIAARVLGCSRQYVHALITSGQLRSETGLSAERRQVSVVDVRDLLKDRIDSLVK